MRILYTGFILLALAGCTDKSTSSKPDTYSATAIVDNVYVIHGPLGLPNKANKGFMNNPGFVITNKGVVVIDPGSSKGTGDMVLKEIKKYSKLPVVAMFNTHIHGDHWLGNEAIKLAYPDAVIYAHKNMRQAAKTDGANWVKIIKDATEGTMVPTKVVIPEKEVKHDEVIKVGDLSFHILHYGQAHTTGDIMIEVVEKKVLFVGDIALHKRLPLMNDGHFQGNINSLNKILDSNISNFVPGHGTTGGKEVIRPFRDYLVLMKKRIGELYESNMSDFEMKPKLSPEFSAWHNWVGFTEEFGRHISLCYLEVEKELF